MILRSERVWIIILLWVITALIIFPLDNIASSIFLSLLTVSSWVSWHKYQDKLVRYYDKLQQHPLVGGIVIVSVPGFFLAGGHYLSLIIRGFDYNVEHFSYWAIAWIGFFSLILSSYIAIQLIPDPIKHPRDLLTNFISMLRNAKATDTHVYFLSPAPNPGELNDIDKLDRMEEGRFHEYYNILKRLSEDTNTNQILDDSEEGELDRNQLSEDETNFRIVVSFFEFRDNDDNILTEQTPLYRYLEWFWNQNRGIHEKMRGFDDDALKNKKDLYFRRCRKLLEKWDDLIDSDIVEYYPLSHMSVDRVVEEGAPVLILVAGQKNGFWGRSFLTSAGINFEASPTALDPTGLFDVFEIVEVR